MSGFSPNVPNAWTRTATLTPRGKIHAGQVLIESGLQHGTSSKVFKFPNGLTRDTGWMVVNGYQFKTLLESQYNGK